VAPALHMLKGDLPQRLEDVARRGGSVVATFLSGRLDESANAFLMDVPGPLGPLMGVRVDEWDARGPEVTNPVVFTDGTEAASRLLFEIVLPQGAETVGTYRSDFYAGTPAVTRNAFGDGFGWYVAAGLDQDGVAWVLREVLQRHGLGEVAVPGLERATRVSPTGQRLQFLLNHGPDPVEVASPGDTVDLLSAAQYADGAPVTLAPSAVAILSPRR